LINVTRRLGRRTCNLQLHPS